MTDDTSAGAVMRPRPFPPSEAGQKGGSGPELPQELSALEGWVPIPRNLILAMGQINVEVFKVFVWLIHCDWEAGARGPTVQRLARIAEGAGLSVTMARVCLTSLSRAGFVTQTSGGWRLNRIDPDEISPQHLEP